MSYLTCLFCLFWIFHINGIMHNVVSLSRFFNLAHSSSFFYVVECSRTSLIFIAISMVKYGWSSQVVLMGKEYTSQCRRHKFDPWVRKIPWRSAWQPSPVFLPGEDQGQRSLVGYSSKGCKEVPQIKSQSKCVTLGNPWRSIC